MILAALLFPASALAGGGNYVFEGAKPAERSTVRAALEASTFDWGVVPQQVTIHVGRYGVSHSTPGHWLSKDNSYRPESRTDESAAMPPAEFRALVTTLVGAQRTTLARP